MGLCRGYACTRPVFVESSRLISSLGCYKCSCLIWKTLAWPCGVDAVMNVSCLFGPNDPSIPIRSQLSVQKHIQMTSLRVWSGQQGSLLYRETCCCLFSTPSCFWVLVWLYKWSTLWHSETFVLEEHSWTVFYHGHIRHIYLLHCWFSTIFFFLYNEFTARRTALSSADPYIRF